MERGRIERLPKFFEYPLLSQEQIKLRTSNFVRTFLVSIGTKALYKFLEKQPGAFARTQGTHILGASRGRLCDSKAFLFIYLLTFFLGSGCETSGLSLLIGLAKCNVTIIFYWYACCKASSIPYCQSTWLSVLYVCIVGKGRTGVCVCVSVSLTLNILTMNNFPVRFLATLLF